MGNPDPYRGKKRRINHARRGLGVSLACVPFWLLPSRRPWTGKLFRWTRLPPGHFFHGKSLLPRAVHLNGWIGWTEPRQAPPFFLLLLTATSGGGYGKWGQFAGLVFMLAALFVAVSNVYLSIVRPWLYQRTHGSMVGFKNVSGLPLVGLLFVLLGGFFGRGSLSCAVLGAVALLLDTGGIHWFVVATWRDSSIWDE